MHRGQTAVEYLAYFTFFLLIAAIFTAYVFTQASDELNKRSQERFKSTIFYLAQSIRDVDSLASHADYAEINVTLPVITKGAGITIEGNEEKGILSANTTVGNSNVYYYVRIGNFSRVSVLPQPREDIVTIRKKR